MRQHIIPDCPECNGEGSVPFFPEIRDSFVRRPCSACCARWDEMHCEECEAPLVAPAINGTRDGRTVRVCSVGCGERYNERIRKSWAPLVTWPWYLATGGV